MNNVFLKAFAWTLGVFRGSKAAHAVAGDPAAAAFAGLLLLGAQAALASAPHLSGAEKGAASDALAGVPVHDDPATYTGALLDAVAGSGLPQPVKDTVGIGLHFAAATAIAATAPPADETRGDGPALTLHISDQNISDQTNNQSGHVGGDAEQVGDAGPALEMLQAPAPEEHA